MSGPSRAFLELASGRLQGAALWEKLHDRYAERVRRHIRAVLGPDDEHEDLLQDVLITVFRRFDSVTDPACLDGWVRQVTINTLKHSLRRRRLRRHARCDSLAEWQLPSVETDVFARELASRAIDVMDRLPSPDRVLLEAYWFTPATADSIAAESGRSIATVRRRLLRARLRFERLARKDGALARCIDDARAWSRRWRHGRCDDECSAEGELNIAADAAQ